MKHFFEKPHTQLIEFCDFVMVSLERRPGGSPRVVFVKRLCRKLNESCHLSATLFVCALVVVVVTSCPVPSR